MRVISHRCMGFGERANSALALIAALRSNVDEVELDFRVTSDGELVASHLDIYTDKSYLPHIASRRDLRDNQDSGLMSLQDCLTLFKQGGGGKRLRIEIKSRDVEQLVMQTLKRHDLTDRVVIASWHADVLKKFRSLSPDIELSLSYLMGLQGAGSIPFAWPSSTPKALYDKELKISSVTVVCGVFKLTQQCVAKLLACGVEVFTLSRGGKSELERLSRLGVTGAMFSNLVETPVIINGV